MSGAATPTFGPAPTTTQEKKTNQSTIFKESLKQNRCDASSESGSHLRKAQIFAKRIPSEKRREACNANVSVRIPAASRRELAHGAFCERPRATAGRPYKFKIHLQSYRCKGVLDRFELAKRLKYVQNCDIIKPRKAVE